MKIPPKQVRDSVVRELAHIAFSDLRDFAEWGPDGIKVRRHEEISNEGARAVESVRETRYGVTVRLHP